MKEINVRNIRPIAEPRSPEKAAPKQSGTGQNFSKALEQAVTEMNEVTRQNPASGAPADAASIQDQYSAAKRQFDTLMRVEQQLRQLHQNITTKPTPDER